MDKINIIVLSLLFLAGCSTTGTSVVQGPESAGAQIDAAKKVVGALSPDKGSVEKYSPVTGKHYSGALEYEPGTGVKLVPVEE
jgi:uncharacterized lipoprotein YajG